jgi:hypothetical protein
VKKIVLSLSAVLALTSAGWGEENVVLVSDTAPARAVVETDTSYWYAGVALNYERVYSTDSGWFDDGVATQDEIGSISLIVGYTINDFLAVEGRISSSISEESYAETTNYSIFLKPYYAFVDDERTVEEEEEGFFTVYGLLGFGKVDIKGTNGEPPAHPEDFGKTISDDTSFQWGFGLSYTFVNHDDDESIEEIHDGDVTIYIEYVSLLSDASIYSRLYGYDPKYYTELSQDSINIGITYRF